jgi:Trk K+ transport system NAD-binding subunit
VTRIGICGWNEKAREVIRQLRDPEIARHRRYRLTVIAEPGSAPVEERNGVDLHENVSFVFGDPTRRQVLKNAGVADLATLLVLADDGDGPRRKVADFRTLMCALAAAELNPRLHIVAEVLNSANQEHFRRIDRTEIVCDEDVAEKVLAQAVISPGITAVFLELLTAGEDSNEVYIVPVPERWLGKTFQAARDEASASGEEVVLLGYRTAAEGGKRRLTLNPRRPRRVGGEAPDGLQHALAAEDELVVMAYEEPCW